MADIFIPSKRSRIMEKIGPKDSKVEILVRKYLHDKGLRFRKNDKRYPGKPDIVLPKYKTIIFIHGCFWHSHTCPAGTRPKSNQDFWNKKIESNIERDKKNAANLTNLGWNVLTVWQCELKNKKVQEITLATLLKNIKNEVYRHAPSPVTL